MKNLFTNTIGKLFKIRSLSPQGFVAWAIFFMLLFSIIHALGWREHTTFISGTAASDDGSVRNSAVKGLVYLLTYFGFVLMTPILLIAAGLWKIFRRFSQPGKADAQEIIDPAKISSPSPCSSPHPMGRGE